MLIAGERRILAFQKLGNTAIPTTVVDLAKIATGKYAENFFRKAFSPSEIVAITEAIEPAARAESKQWQASALKRGSRPGKFAARESVNGRALVRRQSNGSGRLAGSTARDSMGEIPAS